MARLDGMTALITGAASGIGAATARRFVAEGATVVVADVQDEVGEALAASLGDAGAYQHCDVVHEHEVRDAVAVAVARTGRLDVVVNNAGFGGATGPIDEITTSEYDTTMDVLVRSVFYGAKHAAPVMKRQRSGSIINTASVCGFRGGIGAHLYSAAKAAVIGLTRSVALELAEWDVRVNAICPGYVATPLAAGRALSDSPEDAERRLDRMREEIRDEQALARMGEPDDVASVAVFLAGEDSAWMTGTTQVIDGGLLAGRPWRQQPRAMTEHRPIRMYDPAERT